MSGRRVALKLSSIVRRGPGFWLLVTLCSVKLSAQEPPPVIEISPADLTLRGRQFSQIQSLRELGDGRLLLSDRLEQSIFLVDLRAEKVRSIGRIGDGPGEYRSPGFLYALGGDSTLLTDPASHRWFLLVSDGIVETISATRQPFPGGLGSILHGVDRFGWVLAMEGFAYAPEAFIHSRVVADSVRALLAMASVLGADASELDTIAELGGQGRLGVVDMTGISPLASEGQAWLFRDGWIAVARPDPYRVDWRTPEGRWIRGATLPFTPVKVNRREKCFIIAWRGWSRDGECRPERFPGWPDHIPPFVMLTPSTAPGGTALRAAPNGMLLVRRTPTEDSPENRYDVVDRSGALRGVIRMPAGRTIIGFGRSSLYVVQKDDMDLLTLSRHPLPTRLGGR